jgi:glycosyltransferase involved in cell wall biosynthesis
VGIKESAQELHRIQESIENNKVSDRVRVMTDISREELRRTLRRSKVFLHVTNGEHFGVAVAEAMASGCIPIVHDSGGPREFVPQHLRFNKLREASEKIEKAIFDWSPQESKSMANLAKSLDEDAFSERFTEIFNSYHNRIGSVTSLSSNIDTIYRAFV